MLVEIASSAITSAVVVGLLAFMSRTWFEARLRASIDHEYKKQFEIFQREQNRKQKVELVAELLAEYMKTPYGETIEREQRVRLNKLSLQASLWLPQELAVQLAKRLQNLPDALTPYDLILLARKQLGSQEPLSVEHVTIWGWDKEIKVEPLLHGTSVGRQGAVIEGSIGEAAPR